MNTLKRCSKCGEPKTKSGTRWRCRPCDNAYQREQYRKDPEKIRKRKREYMRRVRSDPLRREEINQRRRGNEVYLEKGRAYNRILREKHFFKWRARLTNRSGKNVTAQELATLWKNQRGHCALSGTKLGRDAHLDHIVPVSKNGKTSLENLRWLDPWVNVARQNLSDEIFVSKCRQVAEWIGRRIMEHEASQQTGYQLG